MEKSKDASASLFESQLRRSGLSDDLSNRLAMEGFREENFPKIDAPLLRTLGFLGTEILQIMEVKERGLSVVPAETEIEVPQTADDILTPYFSRNELAAMSSYEKQPLSEQVTRWKEAVIAEPKWAYILKPGFVTKYEAKQERTQKKKGTTTSKEQSEESQAKRATLRPREQAGQSSALTESTSGQSTSGQSTSGQSTSSQSTLAQSTSSQSTLAQSTSVRSTTAKSTSSSSTSSTSKSSSSALDALIEKNRSAATTSANCTTWKREDVCPKFDVVDVLSKKFTNDARGATILKNLQDNELLSSADRKCVVRHLTRWLYFDYVSNPLHVTSLMKEELAKSISVTFPKTFWLAEHENLPPWTHLFDIKDNTGYIVNAARPIQKVNKKRKTKKSKSSSDESDCEEENDGIDRLSLIVPNAKIETKQEILRGMSKYFNLRKKEREQGESITFFLSKYIHFTSYGGEVILEEFDKMHPNINPNSLPSKFLEVMPKILSLPAKRDIELNLNENVLLALVLLSQHLPHDIPRKTDGKVEHSWAREEDLIEVLQSKDNVDDHIIDKRSSAEGSVQPYLILIRSDLDEKIVRYFLVLESKALELSCVNLSSNHATLQALDILMKAYVVFNVHHPFGWRNALHFVQHFCLGVEERNTSRGKKSKASPSQASMWAKLNS